MVQKQGFIIKTKVTNGVVQSIPEEHRWSGWRVNIMNASDWSSRNSKWMPKKIPSIDLEDA